jgi:hypothetical protein
MYYFFRRRAAHPRAIITTPNATKARPVNRGRCPISAKHQRDDDTGDSKHNATSDKRLRILIHRNHPRIFNRPDVSHDGYAPTVNVTS